MATIQEIADMAGVSTATVSLVINQRGGVAEQTAKAVKRAMAELRYQPATGREKRGRPRREERPTVRERVLVLGMGGDRRLMPTTPVYQRFWRGAEERLRQAGLDLTFLYLGADDAWPDEVRLAEFMGSVVLASSKCFDRLLRELRLPCVRGMGQGGLWCDHVSYDDTRVGQLAARYLRARGRDWALALADGLRGQAFIQEFTRLGGTAEHCWDDRLYRENVDQVTLNRELIREFVKARLPRTAEPCGLFCSADIVTAAVYPVLYETDFRPGRDVDVVSCNNDWPFLHGLHPRPATVDIHPHEVGRQAVERLLGRRANPDAPLGRTLLQPTLILPDGREVAGPEDTVEAIARALAKRGDK